MKLRALLTLSTLGMALALGACAADRDAAMPMAGVGDIASYDAMNHATQACSASGGTLVLRGGGNPNYVSDYACRTRQGGS